MLRILIGIVACTALLSAAEPDNERVFRSGWSASVTHVGPAGGYSALSFVAATEVLNDRLRAKFPDSRSEAFLVPRAYGYDVVILSRRPLLKNEELEIFRWVEALLAADPVKLIQERANQPPEPTR